MHWLSSDSHALLDHLGPEPLSDAFDGEYLQQARRRSSAVKLFGCQDRCGRGQHLC